MAERDTLLSTLPDDVRDEAAEMYTDKATQDPRDILAELHRGGRIDAGQLRKSVLQLEAQLRIRRIKESPPDVLDPTVLGPLGEGAMGEVMLARDEGLNRVVALKRLHKDHKDHKGLMRRFYTEAQVTAQLDHPSIVPIHGVYPGDDGTLAYTMKLVRGETLEDYLAEAKRQEASGRVDAEHNQQARLHRFLHVCDAIAYAHAKGVLHRDLKPENIMVGAFGEVLVMDWGIAKLLEGSNVELLDAETGLSRKATKTRIGRIVGTPRYMSPEQAQGKNDVIDAPADQYALGLILQELVCFTPGCPEKVTLEEALTRAQKGTRQPMKASAGASPKRELVAIVDKACAVAPDRRYASVDDMAEDIRRALRDEAVLAKRDSILQRMGRFVSRHRTGALLTIALLLLTLVVTSGFLATAALGAHEYRRYVQSVNEARYGEVLADTSAAAFAIDEEMSQVEAIVVGLSYAAERSLSSQDDVEMPASYDPNKAPRYMGRIPKSKVYGRTMVANYPTMALAGAPDASRRDDVMRLAQLAPQLARALGDSKGREEKAMDRKSINKMVAKGVPARWVRVATENGVMVTAPGWSAMQRGLDGRKASWYKAGKKRARATWMAPPSVDSDLKELVLTVVHPVHNERKGSLQAVVSLDLSLDEIIGRMKTKQATNAWILDSEGRVVATKEMKGASTYDPEDFPDRRVWDAILMKEDGSKASVPSGAGFKPIGGKLYSWSTLTTVPWVFISVQPLVK